MPGIGSRVKAIRGRSHRLLRLQPRRTKKPKNNPMHSRNPAVTTAVLPNQLDRRAKQVYGSRMEDSGRDAKPNDLPRTTCLGERYAAAHDMAPRTTWRRPPCSASLAMHTLAQRPRQAGTRRARGSQYPHADGKNLQANARSCNAHNSRCIARACEYEQNDLETQTIASMHIEDGRSQSTHI